MKKWIGALCTGLAGVLSLIFLTIPAFVLDATGLKGSASGWELLTKSKDKLDLEFVADMSDYKALTWYRVFAWILVVLAIVLIVACVLQVLANLNVIKMPAIVNTVAKYALIALAVVTVLTLIANFGIRNEIIDEYKDMHASSSTLKEVRDAYSVGASLWLVTIANAAAAVCANLFAKKD